MANQFVGEHDAMFQTVGEINYSCMEIKAKPLSQWDKEEAPYFMGSQRETFWERGK